MSDGDDNGHGHGDNWYNNRHPFAPVDQSEGYRGDHW